MNKKVSFLLPSYNHECFIYKALESIRLDMEFLNNSAELIIIDDGSADASQDIIWKWIQKYQATLKIVHFFQKNEGVSSVLNKLVEAASGDFLRLCASDDLIVPGSTSLLLKEFKNKDNLICVIGDALVVDGEGKVNDNSSIGYHGGRVDHLLDEQLITRELIQNWCVAGPSFLIRKSHYQSIQYIEKAKIDDYHLFLSLLETPGSVAFLNQAVCKYRVHDTNTSKTQDVSRRIDNLESFLGIVEAYIGRRALKPYLLPVKYRTIAKISYLEGKYFKASVNMLVSILFKFK